MGAVELWFNVEHEFCGTHLLPSTYGVSLPLICRLILRSHNMSLLIVSHQCRLLPHDPPKLRLTVQMKALGQRCLNNH
jgi:hypothetical protein